MSEKFNDEIVTRLAQQLEKLRQLNEGSCTQEDFLVFSNITNTVQLVNLTEIAKETLERVKDLEQKS